MKVCRGFTLLELMVVIAVLAVLVTAGVPGFRDLIQNNRAATQANELVTALYLARSEAIKRSRNVEVVVADLATGWSATVAITGGGGTLRTVNREGSAITVNEATVVFTPTGAPVGGETFNLQPTGGCTGNKRREVVVGMSGQITTTRQPCT
jgi:type IV fimbrial biogenesis protein FimT